MERQVLHINVANFLATVEELCDNSLKEEPFVIGPTNARRAVVIDLSEKAYKEGIRKGMPLKKVQRVGGIPVLSPRYELYAKAEMALYKRALQFAPVVEKLSGGHLYLDITGTKKIFGKPTDHAAHIKREILDDLKIDSIVSHAGNKLVAKVATRIIKPYGFISVYHGDEELFLRNQDVELLPGVGVKLLERMDLLGIQTAGELAEISDDDITTVFGIQGLRLKDTAKGIDYSPISPLPSHLRRIQEERILGSDTSDRDELEAYLYILGEGAGLTLRQNNMLAAGVEVEISYIDGITRKGTMKLQNASFCDRDFFDATRQVLRRIFDRRVRVRKISMGLTRLQEGTMQLDLFVPDARIKRENLQGTIDSIRKKFGKKAIHVASTLSGGDVR